MRSSTASGSASSPAVPPPSKAVLRRAIGASAIGNAVEWFDYGIYAYGTVYIANALFPADSTNAVLFTLVGFALSFLAVLAVPDELRNVADRSGALQTREKLAGPRPVPWRLREEASLVLLEEIGGLRQQRMHGAPGKLAMADFAPLG